MTYRLIKMLHTYDILLLNDKVHSKHTVVLYSRKVVVTYTFNLFPNILTNFGLTISQNHSYCSTILCIISDVYF